MLSTTPFLLLIGIGILRTVATSAGRRTYMVCHLTLLASLAMVVLFWGEPRFRDANMPVLMVYAAEGGGWIAARVGPWKRGQKASDPASKVIVQSSVDGHSSPMISS
jgi:hypothetical protein